MQQAPPMELKLKSRKLYEELSTVIWVLLRSVLTLLHAVTAYIIIAPICMQRELLKWNHHSVSKHWALITRLHNAITHTNGDLNCTAAKPWKLSCTAVILQVSTVPTQTPLHAALYMLKETALHLSPNWPTVHHTNMARLFQAVVKMQQNEMNEPANIVKKIF